MNFERLCMIIFALCCIVVGACMVSISVEIRTKTKILEKQNEILLLQVKEAKVQNDMLYNIYFAIEKNQLPTAPF